MARLRALGYIGVTVSIVIFTIYTFFTYRSWTVPQEESSRFLNEVQFRPPQYLYTSNFDDFYAFPFRVFHIT